jgi:hypothetical protein
MTGEQKAWLTAHPEYRPIGVTAGRTRFVKRGALKPDGTFVAVTRASPLIDESAGSFGVGVLVQWEAGRPNDVSPVGFSGKI